MIDLTETQASVLAFIRDFIATEQMPPTRQDICDRFGWKSPNAAQEVIAALEHKGAIEVRRKIARGIRLKNGRP